MLHFIKKLEIKYYIDYKKIYTKHIKQLEIKLKIFCDTINSPKTKQIVIVISNHLIFKLLS